VLFHCVFTQLLLVLDGAYTDNPYLQQGLDQLVDLKYTLNSIDLIDITNQLINHLILSIWIDKPTNHSTVKIAEITTTNRSLTILNKPKDYEPWK
jgi:hypothetical protein